MSREIKYIGMDVHKEAIVIAVLNGSGKLVMETILETKASSILQFIHGLRGELHVTWEEGTWAAWLYDLLQPQVQQVVVCNPRRNALLKEGSKSDKVDARKLAELLRTGMLRPVYHGENGLRTLRELARSYQTISQDLTRVMNRLKALYRGWGIPCAGTQVYAPRELAVLLLQFLQSLRLVHLQPAVLLSPAVERLHCDLGFLAGLWGGFSVRDAYFDLPQHRHDLLWFVPLDRHGQLFLQVDSLSFHLVQKSPVTSLRISECYTAVVANPDKSNGYEEVASMFIAGRGRDSSETGAVDVADWSQTLPGGATVLGWIASNRKVAVKASPAEERERLIQTDRPPNRTGGISPVAVRPSVGGVVDFS